MTIRLKLTLIYSLILALVVVIFSIALYASQSRIALDLVERTLTRSHNRFVSPDFRLGGAERPSLPERGPGEEPSDFLPILVQWRDLDDVIIDRSSQLGDLTLPLSEAGYRAVIQDDAWLERVQIDDEWFLIRSQLHDRGDTTSTVEPLIVQVALPITDQLAYLNGLKTILAVGDLVIVIIAFGIGWTVAGVTLHPIHRITQIARSVGKERDFSRRVDHTGPNDEIGQLATTFNEMLEALQAAYTQVAQALHAQQRFVADASHELRTPLTTIRGNLELLQHGAAVDPAEQQDILADTVEETERLTRLVSDLLTLARFDAQQALPCQPVALAPLLTDLCRQMQGVAVDHQLVCAAMPTVTVLAHADALKQIVLILLDNALKHTPPGTAVTLAATANAASATIQVQDNGPGIEPAIQPHIFERFYRGDAARMGASAGLGLAIARELVTAQGGTIALESSQHSGDGIDARGEAGSMFVVTLPRIRVETAAT